MITYTGVMKCAIVVMVLAATTSVHAGRKCRRPPPEPPLVFYSDAADVHADRTWHRTVKPESPEKTGKLSVAAFDRFTVFRRSPAKDAEIIACLDALIADERDPARACAVRTKK